MEWRRQTRLSCTDAFIEAQRWIEKVTGKSFDCKDFRAALENGVLLCDLINQLKPGIIKRVNRLSTPIAGLDNVSLFLKACGKLGLNESQLFHPGDLQDLSSRVTLKRDEGNRRIKNVLITIYWLGRKAHQDLFYRGPQLKLKYFEGLLGLALSRALDDGSSCCNHKDFQRKTPSYKRYSSVDSVTSPDARARHAFNSEGCGSDAEAEQVFKTEHPSPRSHKRYLPPPLQKVKRIQGDHSCTSPLSRSKSLSDIPMVYPVNKVPDETTVLDETRQTSPTYFKGKSTLSKDTEAQWQDDFTKWKNRRRSSKCDVLRSSLDREHVISQMTISGANIQKSPSQSGPIKRDQPSQHSPSSHPYSTSTNKTLKPQWRPHTRAVLAQSSTTEMPYHIATSYGSPAHGPGVGAMSAPDMNNLVKENVASVASVGAAATTPTKGLTYSSQTYVKLSPGHKQQVSQNVTDNFTSTTLPREISKLNAAAEGLALVNRSDVVTVNDLAIPTSNCGWKETSKLQCFDKYLSRSGPWSGSASLPRGFRRSEGTSRFSSAITAKPFGTKPCRVSSLPRLCNDKDSQENSLSSHYVSAPVTQLKRQAASVHLKDQRLEKSCSSLTNIKANGLKPQPLVQTSPQPQFCTTEAPQLRSSSTLVKDSRSPGKEDHSDMRLCLTLKPSSRPDFGFQTHWDGAGVRVTSIQPGTPADLCHLCINDEIIAVDGVKVTQLNFSQCKNKMSSALQTGSLTMDVRRYGNKGGSESAISDLQVPSLSPSSCGWSWDKEDERRRQEKWQEEQQRLLQEKYQRDQERLEAEWRKAQQDASSDDKEEDFTNDRAVSSSADLQVQAHVNGLIRKTRDEDTDAVDGDKDKSVSDATEKLQEKTSEDWVKSLSTPALTSPQKLTRGAADQRKRKNQPTTVSKAEQERQQILDEMKKRTQLLTDNSWIRQRSASFYKEPVVPGVPIKRYESMDHLESWRHSPVASLTFTFPRPQSAAAGFCGSTKISSSRHSTGSMPPPHRSSAWAVAEISEEQRLESKSGSKMADPAASPAFPNSRMPPSCDQNTALHLLE